MFAANAPDKIKNESVQARTQNADTPDFGFPATATNPFTFFTINLANQTRDVIPAWGYYPAIRDSYLRILSKREPIMAGALYSVTSRIKSLPWSVRGGRNAKQYYQNLFAEADGGQGFGQFISKVVSDLLTQDNGAFIELVGAGRPDQPLVGKVTEIWHLDAAQCWRTFDSEYPVIYTNPLDNSYHRLHRSRVIMLSSYPQPDERARNIGYCAVSRALKMLQIIRNVEIYKDEKISGNFKRAVIYGNGITQKQWDQSFKSSTEDTKNKGFSVYNDIPVILSMLPGMKLDMLDLARLPDGFDYEKEVTLYVYIVALCFGTDAREFWPATTSGATKADATVQHLKAQGKGIADIIKMLETAFNWQIMPSNGGAVFGYDFTDDEQDKAQAEVHFAKATNIALYQNQGWISPEQGYQMAVYSGLIDPRAFTQEALPEMVDDMAPYGNEVVEDTIPPYQGQPPAAPNPQQGQAAKPKKKPRMQSYKTLTGLRSGDINLQRKVTTAALYTGLESYQAELSRLLTDLEAGITGFPDAPTREQVDSLLTAMEDKFATIMPDKLTEAFGKGLVGADPTDKGIKKLKAVGQESLDYFKNSFIDSVKEVLLAALSRSESEGGIDIAWGEVLSPFDSRIKSYGGAYWESVWQGMGDRLQQEEVALRVKRVLDDGASHCKTCPNKTGVYESFADMQASVGLPADGSDDCLSNCKCHVEVETDPGSGDFGPLVGRATVFTQPLFEVLR